LTTQLQQENRNALCRLFAVIVHSGKNSHSGHYFVYVRNITKNEWWKMDDARVQVVTEREVLAAEAYMLFYRAMSHPVKTDLDAQHQKLRGDRRRSHTTNKRKSTTDEWCRKTNFPPHLMGLIERVSEMLSEEVPLTKATLELIEQEAAQSKLYQKQIDSTFYCASGCGLSVLYQLAHTLTLPTRLNYLFGQKLTFKEARKNTGRFCWIFLPN